MKFCELVLELHLLQIFCHTRTDTQADAYIPEIVISRLRNPKTCKSIKKRISKNFSKPILSSTYVEKKIVGSVIIYNQCTAQSNIN